MKNGRKQTKSAVHDHRPLSNDARFCREFPDEDFFETENLLKEYLIPSPEDKKIDRTVNSLTQLMKITKERRSPLAGLSKLLCILSHVLQYSGKWYILFCLLLYSIVLLLIRGSDENPYIAVLLLAPAPFLLAAAGIFRSGRAGMAELEMSLKYSFRQMIMGKLLFAAIFNVLCNAVFSRMLSSANGELDPVRLTILWCAPFMLVSSVSLLVVIKVRGTYASLGCLGIWPALSLLLLAEPGWLEFLAIHVKTELYAVVTFISCLAFIYSITALLSKTIERGDFFDTDAEKHIETIQG